MKKAKTTWQRGDYFGWVEPWEGGGWRACAFSLSVEGEGEYGRGATLCAAISDAIRAWE